MALLALILLAASGAVVVDLLIENSGTQSVQLFGSSFDIARPGTLVLIGVGCGLLAGLALMLLHDAGARRRRSAQALRDAEAERDGLAARVAERDARASREREDAAIVGSAPSSQMSTAEEERPNGWLRRRHVTS